MKRELGGFGKGAEQDQQQRGRVVRGFTQVGRVDNRADGIAAHALCQQHEAGQHGQCTQPCHHQCRAGTTFGAGIFMVEGDEQKACDARPFPEDKERQEIVGPHQPQHAGHEEKEQAIKVTKARIAFQVVGGVKGYARADPRDNEAKEQRQAIETKAERQSQGRRPDNLCR